MHLFVAARTTDENHKKFKEYIRSLKKEIPRGITIKEVKIYEIQFDESQEREVMPILNHFRLEQDQEFGPVGEKRHVGVKIDGFLKWIFRFLPFAKRVEWEKWDSANLPYFPSGPGGWWIHIMYLCKLKDPKTEDGRDIL